jgi:uncharacterized membrane protein YeaQ/YmgE (transglycosylase-associated protein family)
MGLVFLVVLGGVLGWLAAIINSSDNGRGLALNVAAGIGGALLTGLVLAPLLGAGSILEGAYEVDGLLTALAGSLVVLVAVNLLRDRENAE